MDSTNNQQLSPLRLRIGFLFIFLWWAPFWALAPYIANITGLSISLTTQIIMGIQTEVGLLGVYSGQAGISSC